MTLQLKRVMHNGSYCSGRHPSGAACPVGSMRSAAGSTLHAPAAPSAMAHLPSTIQSLATRATTFAASSTLPSWCRTRRAPCSCRCRRWACRTRATRWTRRRPGWYVAVGTGCCRWTSGGRGRSTSPAASSGAPERRPPSQARFLLAVAPLAVSSQARLRRSGPGRTGPRRPVPAGGSPLARPRRGGVPACPSPQARSPPLTEPLAIRGVRP